MPPPVQLGGVSTTDILTTLKNLVTAINTASSAYKNVQGIQSKAGISGSSVLVQQGPGRVCTISITTAGSTAGVIYDANAASVTTNPIYAIPNTVGIVVINMPVQNGIVVAPGTDQIVAISYS